MRLNLSADDLLSTTRAVRKRLDLERPVEREVVEECLRLAVQAPSGSNRQTWRWFVVEDPAKKLAVAEVYRRHFAAYLASSDPDYGTDDPRRDQAPKVRSSAAYLGEHFHEVPLMLIPLHAGRLEGLDVQMAAGTWGSILPAVWSFMLALRERGLGSAWTTMHLGSEREVADILGIPYERYTQVGLFPIAYTKGTDFKPVERVAVDQVLHWDTWGSRKG